MAERLVRRAGYDTLKARRFEFIPIWGMAVYFAYAMRRVDCPECGIVVEEVETVPQCDGTKGVHFDARA